MLGTRSVMAFLATTNSGRAKPFYEDILGLRLVSDEPWALVFSAAGTLLRLQKVEQHTPHPFTALGWHDLCRIYELPDGRLSRRRLGYLTLTLLRLGGDVLALADQCAHLGGPLHQGSLTDDGNGPCVTCPWHGSTFRLADGTVVHGPATARQPAFDTRVVEGGMVQVRPARSAH